MHLGLVQDLTILVKDGSGLFSTVSDVEVKMYQVTHYVSDEGSYAQTPSEIVYEGNYIGPAHGHSFISHGGVQSGLYIVEIFRDGEVLKVKPIFLERKNKLSFTIPL